MLINQNFEWIPKRGVIFLLINIPNTNTEKINDLR